MIPTQMLKGVLEGSILAIIYKKETYGYDIVQQLKEYGFGDIVEGTIYPLLLRLERKQYIVAEFRESTTGPKRKYYSLTSIGREELLSFYKSYKELEHAQHRLFNEIGVDSHE